jgi:phosphoglycerate kinase
MKKLTIRDLEVRGKRVLVRVDFNVPQDKKTGEVKDDTRITAALPTINHLTERGARVILMSHLGRPDGRPNPQFSLLPVVERLKQYFKGEVLFALDCVGDEARKAVDRLEDGGVAVLENVRFHAQEEKNDPEFARQLASLGDLYVNDAFGTAHRAHASTEGVARHFSRNAAGFLMEKEIDFLARLLEAPERPFVSILGGAKVSDKIGVISHLMKIVDIMIIGGGMSYTFLKSRRMEVGKSLCEDDKLEVARELVRLSIDTDVPLLLPIDHVVADGLSAAANHKVVPRGGIEPGWEGVDIGPLTVQKYAGFLSTARTIFWNGPVGVFEYEPFAQGSYAMAKLLAEATGRGATTVVGGGDSIAAVKKAGVADRISHISTGGGASLEFLEGKVLPGVAALTDM